MEVLNAKMVTSITLTVRNQLFIDYLKNLNPKFKLSKFIQTKLDEEMKKRNFNPYEVVKGGTE
jgi:hypothetical protein|tara:strand:- start:498 stop:686 length:189 start_codon:yes stop_codon:yes gene_type:complete